MDTLRLYWKTYKANREMGEDLKEIGATDSIGYAKYVAYRDGYEAAKAEFLKSLGL